MTRLAVATAKVANARTRGGSQPVQPRNPTKKPQNAKAFGAAERAANPAPPSGAQTNATVASYQQPQGAPWDPRAQAETAGNQRSYEDTNANLAASENQNLRQYGWNQTYKNPYSEASRLQRRHTGEGTGNLTTAGLNAYSGSFLNKGDNIDFRFTRDRASSEAAEAAVLAQIARERDQARHNWETGNEEAAAGAAERAAKSETEPQPSGDDGGGGGNRPGLGGDKDNPNAYRAGVGAGKSKPKAPPGYHAYKGPGNQWWFAPDR